MPPYASRATGHVAEVHGTDIVHNLQRTRERAAVGVAAAPHQGAARTRDESDVAAVAAIGVGGRIADREVVVVAHERPRDDGASHRQTAIATIAAIAGEAVETAGAHTACAARDVAELDHAVIVIDREAAGEAVTERRAAIAAMPVAAKAVDAAVTSVAAIGVHHRAVEREVVRVAQQASGERAGNGDATVRAVPAIAAVAAGAPGSGTACTTRDVAELHQAEDCPRS